MALEHDLCKLRKCIPGFVGAITDSEMLMIHYDDLVKLKTTNDAFKKSYLKALENLVTGMDDTRTNLIILTAEERYALLGIFFTAENKRE